MSNNFRDDIANEIITHIEAGTAPWQKPWQEGHSRVAAFNPTSEKNYKGINSIILAMKGYDDPRWLTYKQAKKMDAQVKAGQKSTQVEYWLWSKKVEIKDNKGKSILDDKGNKTFKNVKLQRPQVLYANVFNAEQIDGMKKYVEPELKFDPIEAAEKILKTSQAPINYDQGDSAFYAVAKDSIHLPPAAAFDSAYEFYATALHEMGHSTGHGSRLDRKFAPFGTVDYAKEELRAEISSFMLSTELGLGHYPERHASYVENWLQVLREDKNEIFRAARDAEIIKQWILEPGKRIQLAKSAQNTVKPTKEANMKKGNPNDKQKAEEIKKQYLNVPFTEKNEAKKLGARWDKDNKSWYISDKLDIKDFSKWNKPAEIKESKLSPVDEFAIALKDNGLLIKGEPIMDGKWHRVAVEGDEKKKNSGSYRGFLDGKANGQIINFKLGDKAVRWSYSGENKLNAAELQQAQSDAAARKVENTIALEKLQLDAGKKAVDILVNDKNKSANSHPYLVKKQITHMQLKENENGELLLPVQDINGHIWSIQTIDKDGQKRFLKDGRKTGMMNVVGNIKKSSVANKAVIICEGFSTAASLALASDKTVVVAFDKGNLAPVAEQIRGKYPDLDIIIAADNDHRLENHPTIKKNVGIDAANKAAKSVNATVIIPPLTDEEKSQGLSDFNDIAVSRGNDGLKSCLKALLSKDKTKIKKQSNEMTL